MNDKVSDLEHQLIESKIEQMKTKMHEGFSSINTTITEGFKLMDAENKRQNDISNIQREQILEKQDLTNGRVKALEIVTSSLRYLQQHKKIAGLVFYAIYNILEITTPENIVKVYRWIKLVI